MLITYGEGSRSITSGVLIPHTTENFSRTSVVSEFTCLQILGDAVKRLGNSDSCALQLEAAFVYVDTTHTIQP